MAFSGLRRAFRVVLRRAPHVIVDFFGFAGAAAISYGAWLIYVPSGFLVGGALLMALSVLIGRKLEAPRQ